MGVGVPAAPLLLQFLAGKTVEDGPGTWVPVIAVKDLDRISGFWLKTVSAFTVAITWEVSQHMEALSLCLSATLPFRQINKQTFKKVKGRELQDAGDSCC